MVEQFHSQAIFTLFFNLRKPVFRALLTVFDGSDDFICCKNEDEIWNFIRTKSAREISPLIGEFDDKFRKRRSSYWMTQSVEY